MSLGYDGGQRSPESLPGEHLVLNLANLLLEVPGLGRDRLPDGGIPDPALALPGSTESLLTCSRTSQTTLATISSSYPSER